MFGDMFGVVLHVRIEYTRHSSPQPTDIRGCADSEMVENIALSVGWLCGVGPGATVACRPRALPCLPTWRPSRRRSAGPWRH